MENIDTDPDIYVGDDPYVLVEIDRFDTRIGYRRCDPPGVANQRERGFHATADMWRDRDDKLVIRCVTPFYRISYEVRLRSGAQVPEDKTDDFQEYLFDLLDLWLCEGIDDAPTTGDVYARLGKIPPASNLSFDAADNVRGDSR